MYENGSTDTADFVVVVIEIIRTRFVRKTIFWNIHWNSRKFVYYKNEAFSFVFRRASRKILNGHQTDRTDWTLQFSLMDWPSFADSFNM